MFEDLAKESTLRFVAKAKSLAREVKANLGLGEPDKSPPKKLVELLFEYSKARPSYTPPAGLKEAREAVAEWLSYRYKVEVSPEEVMITPSGKAALFLALGYSSTLYNSALLFDPTYYSYEPVLRTFGVSIRKVKMVRSGASYEFPEVSVGKEVVVLNSPSNPTGSLLGERVLELLEEASRRGGLVVSDEAYDVFVYEGRHVSVLEYERWRDAAMFVYSFSKVLCVPGWRLGAIVAKEEIIKKLAAAASNVYGCACKWEQLALSDYLKNYRKDLENHINEMVREYSSRRELVLKKLEGVATFPGVGKGAFYAFPEFPVSSEELALELAKRGVIAVPGTVFSEAYGNKSLRLSFSASLKELELGLDVIREVIEDIGG